MDGGEAEAADTASTILSLMGLYDGSRAPQDMYWVSRPPPHPYLCLPVLTCSPALPPPLLDAPRSPRHTPTRAGASELTLESRVFKRERDHVSEFPPQASALPSIFLFFLLHVLSGP